MIGKRLTFAGGLLALLLSSPVFASHCPVDAGVIDDALERSTLSGSMKSEVRALRNEGMDLHNAGNHREAERKLAEAMRMLLQGGLNK